MMPTLLVGDFIFVNKYDYGLRLPVVNTKIVEVGEPQRGDVIVFRLPSDPSINYIKRLVGLPGDTIRYINKRLYVNDQPVELVAEGIYDGEDQPGSILGRETARVRRACDTAAARPAQPRGHLRRSGRPLFHDG